MYKNFFKSNPWRGQRFDITTDRSGKEDSGMDEEMVDDSRLSQLTDGKGEGCKGGDIKGDGVGVTGDGSKGNGDGSRGDGDGSKGGVHGNGTKTVNVEGQQALKDNLERGTTSYTSFKYCNNPMKKGIGTQKKDKPDARTASSHPNSRSNSHPNSHLYGFPNDNLNSKSYGHPNGHTESQLNSHPARHPSLNPCGK